jgi:UDP-N-acetylmuramyl pentapeptide phosphotransferase/UDP-N-acetylglucosamine-1-phosphate transferase
MPSVLTVTLFAVAALFLSWGLIGIYLRVVGQTRALDTPNARSMHRIPVPVGAGLAIVAAIILLWPWSYAAREGPEFALIGALAALSALSWIDDRRPLSPAIRLGAQAVAVALLLAKLPAEARIAPAIPTAIERGLLAVAWLWFINLFNFMDGIDGLAGSEAVAIALGYLLLLTRLGTPGPLWHLALITAAACTGYLVWNWHPAKAFMGDAGSIPLGFLLGWLMIDLALRGYWAAAIILPLYFALDATLTLLRRGLSGKKPWQAHREHFYQRAVLGGATPPGVVWRVGAANLVLLVLALVSLEAPLPALGAAAVSVAALLLHLQGLARRRAL